MRIFAGVTLGGASINGEVGENKLLSSFMSRYLENGTRYDQN